MLFRSAPGKNGPASGYFKLARLERYEHMRVTLKAPQYTEALRLLKAEDDARNTADFTLTDLTGKQWNRTRRESGVGEFLGHLVPTVSQGDAGPRRSSQTLPE